jgi:hypothetical protein
MLRIVRTLNQLEEETLEDLEKDESDEVDTVLMLLNFIQKIHGSKSRSGTGYLDSVSRGFPQNIRTNSRIVPQVGHFRFLPNPYLLTIHGPCIPTQTYLNGD